MSGIVEPRPPQDQKVILVDPKGNQANVTPIPPIRERDQTYAGAVTDRRLEFIQEAMESILHELKIANRHFAFMTNEEFDDDNT